MTEEKVKEIIKKAGNALPDDGYSEKEINLAFYMYARGYEQAIQDALEWLKTDAHKYMLFDSYDEVSHWDKRVFDAFRKEMGARTHEQLEVYKLDDKYMAILKKGNYVYSAQGQTRDIATQKVKEMSNKK